jgi:Fe-S-cluster-containing dehydrogenase component
MELRIEPLRCTGCRACELACSYHHERELSFMFSSIILYREERKNYFGVMLKREQDVLLGRPEGVEVMQAGSSGGSSGKPILMRTHCDLCEGLEQALCVEICPTGALSRT